MTEKMPQAEQAFVERRLQSRVPSKPLGIDTVHESILEPTVFDCCDLPASEQFAAWQGHMAGVVDLRLPEGHRQENGFPARQTVWHLGSILLVQQTVPAHSYTRSDSAIRLCPIDHWCITVFRAGRSWTESGGIVAENQPGMMEVRSFGLPFRGRALEAVSSSLILPVDMFADRGGLPASCHNIVVGGHRVQLLIDYLNSIESKLTQLTEGDLSRVRDRLGGMVFESITPHVSSEAWPTRSVQTSLMTRARRFIMANIASPELSAHALCKELAISRTRLYELFETSGGVAHYIRRRRLLAAHSMLSDAADTRKVGEIAHALGFDSAANFSRAFTQEFGYSPIMLRSQRNMGEPTRNIVEDEQRVTTFEHLLRGLRV